MICMTTKPSAVKEIISKFVIWLDLGKDKVRPFEM